MNRIYKRTVRKCGASGFPETPVLQYSNSPIPSDPQMCLPVFPKRCQKIGWKTISRGVVRELTVPESAETSLPARDPHCASPILVDRVHVAGDQTVLFRIDRNNLPA